LQMWGGGKPPLSLSYERWIAAIGLAIQNISHSHGWKFYLERLAIAGAGGDPGPHRKPTYG
jgi:hypothetical protein